MIKLRFGEIGTLVIGVRLQNEHNISEQDDDQSQNKYDMSGQSDNRVVTRYAIQMR